MNITLTVLATTSIIYLLVGILIAIGSYKLYSRMSVTRYHWLTESLGLVVVSTTWPWFLYRVLTNQETLLIKKVDKSSDKHYH